MIRPGVEWERGRNVPRGQHWLAEGERARLAGLRLPTQRRDFRLGRWTAKRAVARFLGLGPGLDASASIEIAADEHGAPVARHAGRRLDLCVSLSHRAGRAVCAVSSQPMALGCDLERLEPRSPAFVSNFLSPAEAAAVERLEEPARSLRGTLLWSLRESALKALRIGLDVDTRRLRVRLDPIPGREGYRSFSVRVPGSVAGSRPETRLAGWWRIERGWIWSLAGDRPFAPPEPGPLRSRSGP